jgi:(p)ppGpp synthase/HD superfamily hydrolase
MTEMSPRFDEALVYASDIHRKQRRKGSGSPYIAHLLGVAALALEAGADEDQAIAALLHDAVEDQGGAHRLADISRRFGQRVAGIVADCSDSQVEPKPAWRARKETYVASLSTRSRDSLLVSICDKIYNAEAIVSDFRVHDDNLWDRFTGAKEGTLWYYQALSEAFDQHLPGPLAEKFARLVRDMRTPPQPSVQT